MNNNYDSIDEALNIDSDIVESKPIKKPEIIKSKDDDMSPDEMADVELTKMAHNAIGEQKKE